MKTKKILRFYFSAESLERAFDNLIVHKACDYSADAEDNAERICAVIGEKILLERLWAYLDGIISSLSEEERATLLNYSVRRTAVFDGDGERRAAKRALIKFTRRARRLDEFGDGIEVLKKYYCLIRV